MLSPAPYLARSLGALDAILGKAEAHCAAKSIQPEVLCLDRLYPDMFPLARQVQIATDHAKGAVARLAGLEVPVYADDEQGLGELRARVQKTRGFVESVPAAAFDGAEARTIHVKFGPREMTFTAPDFLFGYALPNFYFHMTTAYAILRHNGVEIGKRDFMG